MIYIFKFSDEAMKHQQKAPEKKAAAMPTTKSFSQKVNLHVPSNLSSFQAMAELPG